MAEKELKVTEIEKELVELTHLAFLVNQRTEYIVFIQFMAHVNSMKFSVRESRERYGKVIVESEFYTDHRLTPERVSYIKKHLLEILENGKVNYDNLQYDIEEVYHYKI